MEIDEPNPEPSRKRHVRTLLLWLLGGYWIALFVATHVPPADVPDLGRHGDKVMHFVAYGGLAFLLCTLLWARGWEAWPILVLVVPTLLAYGVADELLQILVGRSAEVLDWVADTVGVVLGCAAFLVARSLLQRLFPVPGSRG